MTFHDFWTGENNPSLPQSEFLYGPRHIFILILAVTLCISLTLFFRRKSDRTKRIVFYVIGGIFLFFEISSRVVNLLKADSLTVERVAKILLPMYICSVMVWVSIFAIFTRKQFLINYAVIGGLLATTAYLLFPAVGLNKMYWSFDAIYSTFSHMLGFVSAVLMMTLGLAKFELKKIWQPFVCFVVMFSWGLLLYFVIFPGSDYMYLVTDPLELNIGFPYQILYIILIAIYTTMFYIIPYVYNRIKSRTKSKVN